MQTIHLDISNKGVIPTIYAKQGDVGRKFRAVITDNGEAYDIPADALLSVWYSGTSGEGNYSMIGENSAFSIDGNTVTVELITQMLPNNGSGNVCLVMNRQDGTQIGTWNIPYIVEQLPGMGSSAAEQYFTALSEVAGKAAESAAKAAEAAATFETDTSLSVAGKAADAAATGEALAGKAPVALGAPYNYLDNSDFRNPVNQRGQTSYTTNGYTIDRWRLLNDNGTLSIGDGYVEFAGSGGQAWLTQLIPNANQHIGKTVTFVVELADYQKICVSGVISATNTIQTAHVGLTLFIHGVTADYIQLNIVVSANTSYQIRNVALYEGEYTAETLPDYKPKGYGVELAECMRYYQACDDRITIAGQFDGNGCLDLCYPLSVEMRTNPTVICNANGDNTIELYVNGEYTTVSVSYQYRSTKYISPRCINGGWANKPCFAAIKFVASADL